MKERLIACNLIIVCSPTQLAATVAVTSFNFTCTAIISMILFDESLPPLWWAGFSMILLGLAFLTYGAQQKGSSGVSGAKKKD